MLAITGLIAEVSDDSFTLKTDKGPVTVVTSTRTKYERLTADLDLLRQQGAILEVERSRLGDGPILAREIERE